LEERKGGREEEEGAQGRRWGGNKTMGGPVKRPEGLIWNEKGVGDEISIADGSSKV